MRQFLGTYENYDIYFVTTDDTGSSPYYEAIDSTLDKSYIVYATDFEEVKRIINSTLGIANEENYYSF